MTATDLGEEPPEPGARDARPLESAIGRPGGATTRRAVFVSLLIIATSLPALIPRLHAEQGHPGTEVAVSSATVSAWARTSPRVLSQLQDAGVRTVVLDMRTAGDLISARQLRQIGTNNIARLRLTRALPAHGRGIWLRSQRNDPSGAWSALVSTLRSRVRAVPGERVRAHRVGKGKAWLGVLRWDTAAAWRDVPVGYDRRRIQQLTSAGFRVLPAVGVLRTRPGWLASEVRHAQRLASSNRFLLLDGAPLRNAVTDGQLVRLLSSGATQVFVSDDLPDDQRQGLDAYVSAFPGRLARVHWADLGGAVSTEALVSSGRRATKERGVRMLAVGAPAATPPLPETLGLLRQWQRDLPTSPIGPQPVAARVADPLPTVGQGYVERGSGLLACFMVVALAVYLLTETRLYVRGHRWRILARPLAALAYCVLAVLALAAWLLKNQTLTAVLVSSAACAGAWAVISTAAAGLRRPPEPGRYGTVGDWSGSLLRFVAAAVVALAVGTAIAAAGAQPDFLLGLQRLGGRGVVSVLPVVAVAVSAIALLRVDRAEAAAESIADAGLRWAGGALVTVLAVGFVAWYLPWSAMPASGEVGPDGLSEWLYVPPRVPELLGYAGLVLALRWPGPMGRYVLLVLAAVGSAVSVDTFCHFDLPYWAAVLRTGYALAGGLVLGALLSLLLPQVLPMLTRRLTVFRPSSRAGSGTMAG